MESKYIVAYSDDNEITNYYFKFLFIESIFGNDTDTPGLYTIIFGTALQPEAKNISIYPECTKNHEMYIPSIGISMPDGGIMTCPYDMEKKELLIDETMWEIKGRRIPTKREYDLYNETVKALIEFLSNEYIGRTMPIKPKFIDKNVEELCVVGNIKDYSKKE